MNHVAAIEIGEPHRMADECRIQLNRILQSGDFEGTEREHRFLAYIVEETLLGRGSRIKAYSIAMEVFGREATFDPQNDPIVRIAAGHLRPALERYYLTSGKADALVITIPKGSYVPTFSSTQILDELPGAEPETGEFALPSNASPSEPLAFSLRGGRLSLWLISLAAAFVLIGVISLLLINGMVSHPAAPETPRVLVSTFEDLPGSKTSKAIANGLTYEIVGQLSKFKDIVVIQDYGNRLGNFTPRPRFSLMGSVELSDKAFRLRVALLNTADGRVLWADSYDGALNTSKLVQTEVAISERVATTLAQSYGVIFQVDAARHVNNPPADWIAYSCTLSYYAYRMNVDSKILPDVRICLEKAVVRFPTYATAWALLAQTYLDEIRFHFPYDPKTAPADIDRALATARHAVELDPLNVRGLQAEMFALFFSRQFEAAKRVGTKALALNPNDTELMGEYGYRLALSGDWENGCRLIREALARNAGSNGYYETGLTLCSFFARDNQNAIMWIQKTTIPKNALYHLIAAGVFGRAGVIDNAQAEVKWLCKNVPQLVKNARAEVSVRLGRAEDVEFFLSSLDKAGMPGERSGKACPQG